MIRDIVTELAALCYIVAITGAIVLTVVAFLGQ
jgi:hypothetical protein